jgi:hypothetical protein
MDGREVGTLSVDAQQVSSVIEVTLPKPGTYSYAVQAKMTVHGYRAPEMTKPVTFEAISTGEGTIEVEAGKQFVLTTNNMQLTPGGRGNRFYAIIEDAAPSPSNPDALRSELQGIVERIRDARARKDPEYMTHELALIGAVEAGLETLGLEKGEFDGMGVDVDVLLRWLSRHGWIRML